MATYYTSSNNPRDPTTMLYLRDPLLGSNTESPGNLHNSVMMFMNNSRPYSSNNNSFQVLPSSRGPASGANHPRQDDVLPNFDAWRHAQQEQQMGVLSSNVVPGQGLSLSLGTQFGPGIQMHSSHPGLTSYTEEEMRDGNLMSQYGKSSGVIVGRTIPSSKYLKAAQQLLDEVVNVRKALKQQQSNNTTTLQNKQDDGAKNLEDQSASNPRSELSHAEKQDFQDKLTKLLSMLDEVHRRYRQYYHQMQIVVSSFDSIAGPGAAKPYSALALQTISRHFRSLRDTITAQIKATRYSLGDHDDFGNNKGVGITRLRFVDRQLRQQRALQQLGMIQQHGWRPQRGLPESSVTILRAWLFEHFLHPYPKDSDKIMLARQTGLTRSQTLQEGMVGPIGGFHLNSLSRVSNWFINARVRLWKPMVEEMYKEEIGEAELESNSSMDNLIKETNDGNRATSEDREEDLQQSASTTLTERFGPGQFMDSKFGTVPDAEMVDPTVLESFPDSMIQSDGGSYHLSELGRFGTGSGVSLTLGLQHCEGSSSSSLPISSGMHQGFFRMRGEDIYDGGPLSSVGQTTDFERMNNVNQQQHRYGSSSMYHDFVV